jgi:hypothetical protein
VRVRIGYVHALSTYLGESIVAWAALQSLFALPFVTFLWHRDMSRVYPHVVLPQEANHVPG